MGKELALRYTTFETPLGWLLVAESGDGIALVDFLGPDLPSEEEVISTVLREYPEARPSHGADDGVLGEAKACILAYLTNRAPLPRVPLDLRKGTCFDRKVWNEIETIAFGKSLTYGQIAARTQNAGAARAVGRACGRNPVPILIPCHRVVGSGGQMGGYSGGLHIKRALLDLEKSETEGLS